ncbi:MAG: baseplate J/gp47 family protein [Anaerolineae bacterium]|nr:baseplate J/gp47 family protein [Anaerolineae bacterium]NUQ02397.1 baseplate J/gp47 family protein [Anaerolineae bacterium]
MPPKPEYVQLEPNEDAASVRDRLTFLRGQRVLLIWPERGTALTRKLDLVLVQREAMRLAIKLALVTHDDDVIRSARELNISTFETIGGSEKQKWKRGRAKVFTNRFHKPKEDPEPDELSEVASRLRAEELTPVQKRIRLITRLAMILIFLLLTGIAAYAALPSATVTIVPLRQTLEVEASVRAVPNSELVRVDVETGVIPALVVRAQVEERAAIATTGVQQLGASRATGAVIFINKTDAEVAIPVGAFVSTGAGAPILFRTMVEAQVPAGQGLQIEVPIEAVEEAAGDTGNVPAGMINTLVGPLAEQVEVRNISPTFGGERRVTSAVSAEDRERLIAILRQQIQDRAFDEMQPRLEERQFLISETIGIVEERADWMSFSHNVGDLTHELTLTMRAVVQATAVDEDLAQQVAFARLAAQIPRSYGVRPDSMVFERRSVTGIDPDGGVTFTVYAAGQASAQIDPWQYQQALAGRSMADATNFLQDSIDLEPGSFPQIILSPEWLPTLPLLAARIRLLVVNL